jgi:hypothetical protein
MTHLAIQEALNGKTMQKRKIGLSQHAQDQATGHDQVEGEHPLQEQKLAVELLLEAVDPRLKSRNRGVQIGLQEIDVRLSRQLRGEGVPDCPGVRLRLLAIDASGYELVDVFERVDRHVLTKGLEPPSLPFSCAGIPPFEKELHARCKAAPVHS